MKYVVTSFRCVFVVNVQHMWLKPATLPKNHSSKGVFHVFEVVQMVPNRASCLIFHLLKSNIMNLIKVDFRIFFFFLKKKKALLFTLFWSCFGRDHPGRSISKFSYVAILIMWCLVGHLPKVKRFEECLIGMSFFWTCSKVKSA